MKKLILSMVAMFFAIGVNAETEAFFDFDNNATALFGIEGRSSGSGSDAVTDGDLKENAVATVNGVTITVEASSTDAKIPNRLWATSPVLRMYDGTLKISAPGHKITSIKISQGKWNAENIFDSGSFANNVWTPDGEVSDVVLTIAGNTQFKSITVKLDGEGGTEPVVLAGTGEGTVESPYDVERALSIIENDAVSGNKVYIAGKITEIEEVSTSYGNATYMIGQGDLTLKIYRGYSLGGEKFTAEDEIKVGDDVVVYGQLVTNYGGQVTTGSSLYSINGKTYTEPETPPYDLQGDGTKANPYTASDVQYLKKEEADGNKYWVKGVILGSATSATKLNDADKAVDTNIALGNSADVKTFIPVELAKDSGFREILGVATNPGNVGKEVLVYGSLEKYFSTAGVKSVTEVIFEGTEHSSINAVITDAAKAGEMFNLAGQKVNAQYKGVVIVNGKKIIRK